MSKPSLLFLAHRIPYPPNKGDKIRSFNILKALARDYRICLGAFVDDDEDWQYQAELREYCSEVFLQSLSPNKKYKALPGLLTGEALTLPYYRNRRMQQWVETKLEADNIERVFVYSSAMAQYVAGPAYQHLHRVIDFVDVDSEKWRAYGQQNNPLMNWVYTREANRLLAFDRAVAAEFDASVFVSEPEAALFKQLAPDSTGRVHALNNGVDTDYFSPAHADQNPYPETEQPLVFTGAMDYWANVDAVIWFVRKVLPLVRQAEPHAHFYIVGARPTAEVSKLADIDGVTVTGAVKEIRPFLKYAVAAVAPMRIARGIQNKVLEALAMSKPVIATSAAMEGISGGDEQWICDTPEHFAEQCLAALQTQAEPINQAGRELVMNEFNWDNNLQKLECLLGDEPAAASHASSAQPAASVAVGELSNQRVYKT